MVMPFSDIGLNQEISRFVIEGRTLKCDFATVYLRFITDGYDLGAWDSSFTRVVSAYLAREISTRIAPKEYSKANAIFEQRVESATAIAARNAPQNRPADTGATINANFLSIFNDALLILGLDTIITVDDDSDRRFKLSQALSAGIVADLLEDTGWLFAYTTTKISYDTAIEPSYGYARAFNKPTDFLRLDGIYQDEYLKNPLRLYHEEGDNWYSEYDTIYINYASSNHVTDTSGWNSYFKRLVAARMALDAGPSLRAEGADVDNAKEQYADRKAEAKANNAVAKPPKIFAQGSWVGGRTRGIDRDRPE